MSQTVASSLALRNTRIINSCTGQTQRCNYIQSHRIRRHGITCFRHVESVLIYEHIFWLQLPFNPKKKNKDGEMKEQSVWRRRRRSNGRAVMRCVSDAFSDCAVLAAAPVNHDYNGEERWEQWCRKSRSDNYNARDKIMGTRCTLPIISCISSWLTPPYWQPAITGHICEIQNGLIWWEQWGLWSVTMYARVFEHSFVKCQRIFTHTFLSKISTWAWHYPCGGKNRSTMSVAAMRQGIPIPDVKKDSNLGIYRSQKNC